MTPAFEQFARSKGWSLLHKGETGEYRALNTQAGWLAWQAREVPAGFVVVPVEPADDMLIRGGEAFFDAARVARNGDTLADQDNAGSIYRAMLAAAPQQPASLGGGV
jgi:hypothetical protein